MSITLPFRSFRFWVNAFIPRDIFGATTTLREGDYRGLSMLSKAPCYLTDQRNFSNEPSASSRMHSLAKVDLVDGQPNLTQGHRCDELIEWDVDGSMSRRQRVSTSNMRFSLTRAEPTIVVQMNCRYADPVTSPAHGIGDIEYQGIVEINPLTPAIDIDLMICLFPAFEGYASVNNGAATVLFRYAPPAGILTRGLPLGAKRRIRSHWEDHDCDFSTTEALAANISSGPDHD